jgi:AraC-like DNA-binding protein
MNRWDVEYAAAQTLSTGYGHYSRVDEICHIASALLGMESTASWGSWKDFPLADQPLRAIKNALIVFVAVICRSAVDLGADDIKSYMLSDCYINEIEQNASREDYKKIIHEVLRHYTDLVREGREGKYSAQITRTIRHIKRRLYEPCTLRDLARDIRVNPNYLSSIFKKETGLTVTQYIQNLKIEEAKRLMVSRKHSIGGIADMLGFTSLSYFSRVFKRLNACGPREYLKKAQEPARRPEGAHRGDGQE